MTSLEASAGRTTPHFNKGNLPVAFVFSVPGAREIARGRPVAGDTGENLTLALHLLHASDADTFPSTDRYAYRITNSWKEPLARSLCSPASEPTDAQVLQSGNITRVVEELRGCTLVLLCGEKAKLLAAWIQSPGTTAIPTSHTGSQALNRRYTNEMFPTTYSSSDRRRGRSEHWAREVLRSIANKQGGPIN
jgi:hypothetical protein